MIIIKKGKNNKCTNSINALYFSVLLYECTKISPLSFNPLFSVDDVSLYTYAHTYDTRNLCQLYCGGVRCRVPKCMGGGGLRVRWCAKPTLINHNVLLYEAASLQTP